MALRDVVKALRRIKVEDLALEATEKFKEEILDLNTEEQLFKGVDAQGQSLGEYSPFTVEIKEAKGQPTDRVTLKDEGDFYNSLFTNTDRFPVKIDSKDPKRNELVERFGTDILGLTGENKDKIVDDQIKEDTQDRFKASVSEAFKRLR